MEPEVIRVADYTKFPGGRYAEDGEGNATNFRTEYLVTPLRNKTRVVVDLGGVAGYSSAFLDEAFGGLVREENLSPEEVLNYMEFKAAPGEHYGTIRRIMQFINSPDSLDCQNGID